MRKKLLALLLAAALALSLLAGCGGGKSVASALLKLLDGRYPNISIEIDPDLEADLRQAIRKAEAENAGDDAAVIRAALETALGSTVTFRNLGEGQQGDTTFDLVFYSGTDPDKAAQAAYSQWDPILSNVPDDGKYGTGLAMVETENGIWMLVKATVEKAGTEDKPEPASVTGISVTPPTKTQYNKGEPFDPTGMVITVTYSDGSTKTISGITTSDKKGVNWSPANINADTTVTITYGGKTDTVAVKLITLTEIKVTQPPTKTEYTVGDSFNPDGMEVTAVYSNGHTEPITDNYTIKIGNDTITSGHTFNTAGTYSLTVTYDGKTSDPVNIHVADQNGYHEDNGTYVVTGIDGLQNLFADTTINAASADITLETDQTLTGTEPLADTFTGTLNGNGNTITMEGDRKQGLFKIIDTSGDTSGKVLNVNIEVSGTISGTVYIGGIAGKLRKGTVTGCSVTGGSISSSGSGSGSGNSDDVGGVVGQNYNGSVNNCYSTVTVSCSAGGNAGGVVGYNYSSGTVNDCYSTGTVSCYAAGGRAGGVVGFNETGGTVNDCYSTGDVSGNGYTGGVVGLNSQNSSVTGCYHADGKVSGGHAGGIVGTNNNGSTVTACYSTGAVSGNGYTGGVVGWNDDGSVTACFSTGAVTGGSHAGGVVGWNGGTVTACYWSDYAGNGIGSGSGDATEVTGDVTWQKAVDAMNIAIAKWNTDNSDKQCNYQYKDGNPPKIIPGAPTSTTTP